MALTKEIFRMKRIKKQYKSRPVIQIYKWKEELYTPQCAAGSLLFVSRMPFCCSNMASWSVRAIYFNFPSFAFYGDL